MPPFDRREFLKLLGASAVAGPGLLACSKSDNGATPAATATQAMPEPDPSAGFYDLPMQGNARILHITDVHGQLNPVYFREPSVNLGFGDAKNRPPHLVGEALLEHAGVAPGSRSDALVEYVDVVPTWLEAAGVAPPEGLDGRSFLPVLTGIVATTHLGARYETLLALHILSVALLLVWLPFGKLMHWFLVFVTRSQTGAHLNHRGAQL